MQRRVISLLSYVSVWVSLLGVGAQAQIHSNRMKVEVPFDFHVQGKRFPAGSYDVLRENSFLYLRDQRGKVLRVLLTQPVELKTAAQGSRLVFYEYQGEHVLTQIRWEGDSTGSQFVRPGKEAETAARLLELRMASAQAGGR